MADGRRLNVIGNARVNIGLKNFKTTYNFRVVAELNHSIPFGIDFLRAVGCHIDLQNNSVSLNNGSTILPLQTLDSTMSLLKLS